MALSRARGDGHRQPAGPCGLAGASLSALIRSSSSLSPTSVSRLCLSHQEEQILHILATLTGSVLAGLGGTIQRGMRGDAVDEAITRRLKLVELYQRMRAVGLDAKGHDKLETDLVGEA